MILSKIKKRIVHERDVRGRISFAFEITTACNLSCGFCFQGVNKRKTVEIPLEDYRKMLLWCKNSASSSGKKKITVSPSASGEFFLIKDPCAYLHETRNIIPEATIGIASNFTCFSEGVLENTIKNRLVDNLTCSLNYSSDKLHSEICGGTGLQTVYDNLDSAISFIKRYNSPLVIDVAMKLHKSVGKSEMEIFKIYALERWGEKININWYPVSCWGGHMDFKGFLPDDSPIDFPCYGLAFPVLLIKAGGDVFPCCCCATVDNAPELRLGNLFKNTREEIGAVHAGIKNQHMHGAWKQLKLCSTCNIYSSDSCNVFFKVGGRYY